MKFHEANHVTTNSFNERVKIRFQDNTITSKRTSTPEVSVPIQLLIKKPVTFIEINNLTRSEFVDTK